MQFGLVLSVDPDTNRVVVRLNDGRVFTNVGYSFPYFSFRDKSGIVYLPKEGQQVLVDIVDNQAYIVGFIMPAGFKNTAPIVPGDFGLFGTKESYVIFSSGGAILVRAGPSTGMNFFPDLAKIEIFSDRFRWLTSLGELNVDIDRYGAKLEINFQDIPLAVPANDIISFEVSSLGTQLFDLKLTRMGMLTIKLFNAIEMSLDGVTQTVNIKLLNLIIDAMNIQLGGNTAVIPATLSTPLINLLIQICNAITTLSGGISSVQAASAANAIIATVLTQLPSIAAKKVKIE